MLDLTGFPWPTSADVRVYNASAITAGANPQIWNRPRGTSMTFMFGVGGGGRGGGGAVGPADSAGGGGGAGSGAQMSVLVPTFMLPEVLFVSVGLGGQANQTTGTGSRVSIYPDDTANHHIISVAGGQNGTTTASSVGGPGGTGGALPALATSPLSGIGLRQSFAGADGIAGGSTGNANNFTLPITGLVVCGGTGGSGSKPASTAGGAGGSYVTPLAAGPLPVHVGGAGGTAAPTAGANGSNGMQVAHMFYFYGGTGGGASGISAGATSANGGSGGQGSFGSGGGGGAAAFSGYTAGVGGDGGPGLVVIVSW